MSSHPGKGITPATHRLSSSASSSQQLPPDLADINCFTDTNGIMTTTMLDVPGYRVTRMLGCVYGITVRTRNWAAGLGMVIKSMAGGELKWFTNMLYRARNDAVGRLVDECRKRGGNAVIGLRFDQGDLGGFAQVCAYGTACYIEKVDPEAELPLYPQLYPGRV